jgi:nicotinate phosphoribosyltransferase
LEAGRRWGIATIGTAAHAFVLLHDSERDAFQAQIATQGTGTTLLLDTYDVQQAVRTAIDVAGSDLKSVRIDSGDLPALAREVRAALDGLGATGTQITVTSDLDEYAIAALGAAPVNSYGVGTRLVTGSGAPTAQMVYKLVAREDGSGVMRPVAKTIGEKATIGGAKWAGRRIDDSGHATAEVLVAGTGPRPGAPEAYGVRPLEVTYVDQGALLPGWTGAWGVTRAAERHRASLAELPRVALRLSDGEGAIPTNLTQALDAAGA